MESITGRERVETAKSQDLLDLLIVLAKHRYRILRTTLLAGVLTAGLSLLLSNEYTAETTLLPPQQRPSMAAAITGQLAGINLLAESGGGWASTLLADPNAVYLGLLQSRSVADALIDRFDLMSVYKASRRSAAHRALAGATQIVSGKEGIISIRVTDRSRERAADLANAYVEELRRMTDRLALSEASQRRLYFERELDKIKGELAEAEFALQQTQEATGLLQLDAQTRALMEMVTSMRGQIAAKEVEIRSMQTFATAQHPGLLRAREELAGLRAQLAGLERKHGLSQGKALLPTGDMPKAGLEYVRRLRDVKYYEAILESVAKQYEAARFDEGQQAVIVQVVDPAQPPDRKSKPYRTLIILVVMFFVGLFMVGYAFIGESRRRLSSDPANEERLQVLRRNLTFSRADLVRFRKE